MDRNWYKYDKLLLNSASICTITDYNYAPSEGSVVPGCMLELVNGVNVFVGADYGTVKSLVAPNVILELDDGVSTDLYLVY